MSDLLERKKRLAKAIQVRKLVDERERCEGRLIEFYKAAWPAVDPAAYQHNWHLDAIAEHLEAVSFGWIRKLCINLPPRHSKTLLVSVAWNAWAWCREDDERYPLIGSSAKFMCLSYADPLAMDNAVLTRRLISSEWYQSRWGKRFSLMADQDAKNKFDTSKGGTRISGSFKGTVTGRGAGIRVYDDPHKMDEVESETIRENVLRLYDTTLKSRITDPRTSAEVLIAQRGHISDLSAKFMEQPDVVHLNLPAEYDSTRRCVTVLKWDDKGVPEKTWGDPRKRDGELLWANRFGPKELAIFKTDPYEWRSQWQQAPAARGGGLFKEEWWQVHEVERNETGFRFIPEFVPDHVIACLDTALSEKEEADYNAMCVFVLFSDAKTKHRRILLVDCWQKKLPMHGEDVERKPGESEGAYNHRAKPKWGLVEWVAYTCRRRKVRTLLIENKTRGHDVNRELRRLYSDSTWGTLMVEPHGDKWARAHSVVGLFTDGMIYAPAQTMPSGDIRWLDHAETAIQECSVFPRGAHDDVVDAVVHALRYMRDNGLAQRKDEVNASIRDAMTHKGQRRILYEV